MYLVSLDILLYLNKYVYCYHVSMFTAITCQLVMRMIAQVNLADLDQLVEAFKGIDVVYHMASYGMSGREQVNEV